MSGAAVYKWEKLAAKLQVFVRLVMLGGYVCEAHNLNRSRNETGSVQTFVSGGQQTGRVSEFVCLFVCLLLLLFWGG